MAEVGENVKFVSRGGVKILVSENTKALGGNDRISAKHPKRVPRRSTRQETHRVPFNLPLLAMALGGLTIGVLAFGGNKGPSPFEVKAEGNSAGITAAIPEGVKEPVSFPKPFEEAYGNLLPGEKEEAFSELRRGMGSLSLTDERITDISKYEPMVRKAARSANIPEDLFLGLVITESRGKPGAVSSAGAKGLTQMMVPVAEKYGLATTDINWEDPTDTDERLDPEKILPGSAAELRSYYDKFGDWSLAFWAWHAGEPAVYRAIQIYADSPGAGGVRLPDIQSAADLADGLATFGYYQNFIKDKKINTFRLFRNDQVQGYFADTPNSDWDKTRIYVELNVEWAMQWNDLVASGIKLNPEQ